VILFNTLATLSGYLYVKHIMNIKHSPKVLFVCKKRQSSGPGPYAKLTSSGLLNSATFVNNMLNKNGIESHIVDIIDNNSIDSEVHKFRPTHVVIEALWVVPNKFDILTKKYPKIKWIVRLHSNTPFLANEGIAMKWIYDYSKYKNVIISVNSQKILRELHGLLKKPVLYTPNYYPVKFSNDTTNIKEYGVLNIGCFGAIRPLKNHLMQAISAIEYANSMGKKLKFHINGTRIENNGNPVLKNLQSLFANNPKHELVEHKWLSHKDFITLLRKMDLSLQVSFSETYNIVTADAVNNNVPVVVSPEIEWVARIFKADPTNSKGMLHKIRLALVFKFFGLHFINKLLLYCDSKKAESIWLKYFKKGEYTY